MKFSEWAKDYDDRNTGKLRVINLEDLLSITEWDNHPHNSNPEEFPKLVYLSPEESKMSPDDGWKYNSTL